jgi:hypothetical protein
MSGRAWLAVGAVILLGAAGAIVYGVIQGWPIPGVNTYTTEHTEYKPPTPPADDVLTDDLLEDKTPPAFDPALVDRRPLGEKGAWLLNASAAVIKLDVPLLRLGAPNAGSPAERMENSARIPPSFPDGTTNVIVFAERYGTCASSGLAADGSTFGNLWSDANSVSLRPKR